MNDCCKKKIKKILAWVRDLSDHHQPYLKMDAREMQAKIVKGIKEEKYK